MYTGDRSYASYAKWNIRREDRSQKKWNAVFFTDGDVSLERKVSAFHEKSTGRSSRLACEINRPIQRWTFVFAFLMFFFYQADSSDKTLFLETDNNLSVFKNTFVFFFIISQCSLASMKEIFSEAYSIFSNEIKIRRLNLEETISTALNSKKLHVILLCIFIHPLLNEQRKN